MNLARYFLDHNLERRADKVAVRFTPPTDGPLGAPEQAFTFAEMYAWSNRAGNHLRALGLREEDRVLFALTDCPAFAAHWFGALRVGGVVAMMNPGVTAEDWAYYLSYTRAAVLVTERKKPSSTSFRIREACE